MDFGIACFFSIQGLGFVINFTMILRGLSESKGNNTAALLGIYTMCGSAAVIMVNGLGGYLFGLHEILPFLVLELPVLVIFTGVMIAD